ncbi:MAG: alkaline phosphatase family protein, partial [Candidatus Hydrothermae bacterium]|nr:alkaline phosphatase family protein [Candidatus Hydrothermae bacterium]
MSRVFVLAIDGVPFSLLRELELFRDLWGEGDLVQMDSVLPTLSSVAWTNFQTGRNPGKHGIFGFIDRKLNPFEIYIPLSRDIKSPTVYELISESNLNAISVNIPLTYPPRHIKGIMVSGFLCTDIK